MTAAVVQPRSDASLNITFTLTITLMGNIDYVKIVDIWPISWSVRFFLHKSLSMNIAVV